MRSFALIFPAVVVALFSWSMFLWALTNGIAKASSDALICLSPLAFLLPCFGRLANRGALITLAWVVAIAPVISVLLGLLVTFGLGLVMGAIGVKNDIEVAMTMSTILWLAIGAYLVGSGWVFRDDLTPKTMVDPDSDPEDTP